MDDTDGCGRVWTVQTGRVWTGVDGYGSDGYGQVWTGTDGYEGYDLNKQDDRTSETRVEGGTEKGLDRDSQEVPPERVTEPSPSNRTLHEYRVEKRGVGEGSTYRRPVTHVTDSTTQNLV